MHTALPDRSQCSILQVFIRHWWPLLSLGCATKKTPAKVVVADSHYQEAHGRSAVVDATSARSFVLLDIVQLQDWLVFG